jgi:hypothetical protein
VSGLWDERFAAGERRQIGHDRARAIRSAVTPGASCSISLTSRLPGSTATALIRCSLPGSGPRGAPDPLYLQGLDARRKLDVAWGVAGCRGHFVLHFAVRDVAVDPERAAAPRRHLGDGRAGYTYWPLLVQLGTAR